MQPKSELGLIMFRTDHFFGMDDPRYLDVFVEFGEDRERFADLIGMAIVAYKWLSREELREMVFMKLGNLGFDSDEDKFYATTFAFIEAIANRCSAYIPYVPMIFVEVIEDADWVNLVYRVYEEDEEECESALPIDLTNECGALGWIGL